LSSPVHKDDNDNGNKINEKDPYETDENYDPFTIEGISKKDDSSKENDDLNNIPPSENKKTLFEFFLDEIKNIRDKTNILDRKLKDDDSDNDSTSTVTSATGSRTNSSGFSISSKSEYDSENYQNSGNQENNINKEDQFSPVTLNALDKEIETNKQNLARLTIDCPDKELQPSVRETLLEEAKYLLSQKGKHLESLYNEAKNTHINDVDVDKLGG
jgi:hypothetical protein